MKNSTFGLQVRMSCIKWAYVGHSRKARVQYGCPTSFRIHWLLSTWFMQNCCQLRQLFNLDIKSCLSWQQFFNIPNFIFVCEPKSSTESIVVCCRDAVRNAARFAVYVATTIIVANHQVRVVILAAITNKTGRICWCRQISVYVLVFRNRLRGEPTK